MSATFPGAIWDGTTRSRQNFSVRRGPDGIDFDRISEEVIATQTAVDTNTGDIADHESRITQNESDIADNVSDISDHESRITQNESDIVDLAATQTYILNSIGGTVTTVSVNTDLSNGYQTVFVNATGGAIQIKLPDPSLQDINKIIVKKIDSSANAITVVPFDSETIDGGSSQVIGAQWDAMSVQTDLTDWFII